MYSDGDLAEIWFRESCRKLSLLDVELPLELVKRVLNKHLKSRVVAATPYMKNRNDPVEWLDRVLKTDCLLSIENMSGQMLRVAVDVTADEEKAESKLQEVSAANFRAARRELRIDRHWVVVVKPTEVSRLATLIDALYSQSDEDIECAIVLIE
jgi:hypothetical protein